MLVVNAGSSSLKLAVFSAGLELVAEARVTEIGAAARLGGAPVKAADHASALEAALTAAGMRLDQLTVAAHRVVHGGQAMTAPCRLDAKAIADIEMLSPLAPLHNPPALACIRALARSRPDLPQIAVFDTAFHAGNPEAALRYALPDAVNSQGIRRYGFHGISFASLVELLPGISGTGLPARLLAFHLGNGASLCAICEGRSEATTMGYSPLDGLTMGTRAGAIDGNAVLRLARDHGIDGAERLLNQKSGLLGLGGQSDMRALHADASPEAQFAVAHFIYWAVRHAGSMIAAMRGLDAIAFTGGIGENDPIVRAGIMRGLGWLGLEFDEAANLANAPRLHGAGSRVAAHIVPAREERYIAQAARALVLEPRPEFRGQ